jgi:hypothetical protein
MTAVEVCNQALAKIDSTELTFPPEPEEVCSEITKALAYQISLELLRN